MTNKQLSQLKLLVPEGMEMLSCYQCADGLYLLRCRDCDGEIYDYFYRYDCDRERFECEHMMRCK